MVEKLKAISLDEELIRGIIDEASSQASDVLKRLQEDWRSWEAKHKVAKEKVENLLNEIEAGSKGRKIRERLREREEACEAIEQQVSDITVEVDSIKRQNLDVQVVCKSLREFKQIADKATPEQLKQLVPLFVESATWHLDRVDLVLFERKLQEAPLLVPGASVNHSNGGAPKRSGWLPRLTNLRTRATRTYGENPRRLRLPLPYHIQLRGKFQTIVFGPPPAGAEGQRVMSQVQLRGLQRTARKQQAFEEQPNIVMQARRYADALNQHPLTTKSQLAELLGVSRVWVYRMLNILKLAPPILDFILAHDSPELRKFLSERRLRPLIKLKSGEQQMRAFRDILRDASVALPV